MLLSIITLLVALSLSAIAAWYSIIGLTAIFASAVIPIIVMGGMLEVAKVVVTVWLHEYWNQCRLAMKLYLVPAVAMLMVITSMGIFGFLSKPHLDQDIISGDVQSKIAVYDEKIKTARENIEADRRQLRQMDEAVDQVMARSTTEEGATKSNAIRKAQARDRTALAKSIEANQKLIGALNEEAAPIRAEIRKVEAEVGPIKYIAALIYGDDPDANLLERAVRWVIILLVIVFDPLAIMMVLASTESMKWARENKKRQEPDVEKSPTEEDCTVTPTPVVPEVAVEEKSILEQHPYLNKPFVHFENLTPMVHQPQQPTQDAEEEPDDHHDTTPTEKAAIKKWKELNPHLTLKGQRFRHRLGEIDELPWMKLIEPTSKTGFGAEFPQDAVRGDTYIRTDSIPNRVFKHNGDEWIEVDKTIADSYTYDTAYIDHLISLLAEGQYDPDFLSESEQEQIAQRLESKSNNHHTE